MTILSTGFFYWFYLHQIRTIGKEGIRHIADSLIRYKQTIRSKHKADQLVVWLTRNEIHHLFIESVPYGGER